MGEPVYCPRCGARGLSDPRFCYMCSDGEADAARAAELVEAAAMGSRDVLRILADTTDPRAFEVVAEAAANGAPQIRRAALIALGGIGDPRGVPAAIANVDDPDELVRHAALGALAELGPTGADAIATRLADPVDRAEAARALAWLHDERARQPLTDIIDSDAVLGEALFRGTTFTALTRLGGPAAIAALERAADRVRSARETGAPEWQITQAASTIGQALVQIRDPVADAAFDRLAAGFGRLYVLPADPPAPFRAPPHPRRTVARRSFELRPVDQPVTAPVTKFGGQTVWIGDPTWPLGVDGGPATFMAQFEIPGRDGLAYLFLDPGADYTDPLAILFAAPGRGPDRFTLASTGPTYASEVPGEPRFASRMILRRVESVAVFEDGFDFDDWAVLDESQPERDDHRDYNKVGGTARWLQTDDTVDGDGWRFVFQFTAAMVGHELGDGAEVYGQIHDDGRGLVTVHSH
jgi:hypothetical protein